MEDVSLFCVPTGRCARNARRGVFLSAAFLMMLGSRAPGGDANRATDLPVNRELGQRLGNFTLKARAIKTAPPAPRGLALSRTIPSSSTPAF